MTVVACDTDDAGTEQKDASTRGAVFTVIPFATIPFPTRCH
jgi:hypothetical protein